MKQIMRFVLFIKQKGGSFEGSRLFVLRKIVPKPTKMKWHKTCC